MPELHPHRRWLDEIFDIRRPLRTRGGELDIEVNFDPEMGMMFWGRVKGIDSTIWWWTDTGEETRGYKELDLVPSLDPHPFEGRNATLQ